MKTLLLFPNSSKRQRMRMLRLLTEQVIDAVDVVGVDADDNVVVDVESR